MSRKHFQAIASAIASMSPECRVEAAKAMADVCSHFNGQFDKGRFYTACSLRIDDVGRYVPIGYVYNASGKLVTCKPFVA